ncbi:MAG: hypothetical protein ABFS08_07175 [Pseudomonadota bacterium]
MMNDTSSKTRATASPSKQDQPPFKRVASRDVYDWALYELTCARRVESSAGIDTADLREQILLALQKDLYEHLGEDKTI